MHPNYFPLFVEERYTFYGKCKQLSRAFEKIKFTIISTKTRIRHINPGPDEAGSQ